MRHLSDRIPLRDSEVIDVSPRRRRRWVGFAIGAIVVALFWRHGCSLFISPPFGLIPSASRRSTGTSSSSKRCFFLSLPSSRSALLRGAFRLLEKTFAAETTGQTNNPGQQPAGRVFSRTFCQSCRVGTLGRVRTCSTAFAMMRMWERFALYFNQTQTAWSDPIFNKPLGFYLFSLPVYELISSWLMTLAFVSLCAAIVFSLFTISGTVLKKRQSPSARKPFTAVSIALAVFLIVFAWRVYLSRFPYLWQDHQIFTGVTFTEANYLLPALFSFLLRC